MFRECLDSNVLVRFGSADSCAVHFGFGFGLSRVVRTGCMGCGASGFDGVLGDVGVCDDGGSERWFGGSGSGWDLVLSGVVKGLFSAKDADSG